MTANSVFTIRSWHVLERIKQVFFTRDKKGVDLPSLEEIKGKFESYYKHIWSKAYNPLWVDKQILDMLFFLEKGNVSPPQTDEKWVEWIEAWLSKKRPEYKSWLKRFDTGTKKNPSINKKQETLMAIHEDSWKASNNEFRRLLEKNNATCLNDLVKLFKKGELKT